MTAPKIGFEELIARIASLRSANERVSVAIAGFGGSGKSTLAFRMRHRFEGDCTIVSTDLLYSRTPHSRSVLGMTDWATFAAIAKSVHSEERLRYCGRTYFGDEFEVDEPMPNIVVFEGIRLLRPELMSLYDVAVWIDCPQDIATARAKQRNAQQGDSDAELALWDTLWTPNDARYFAQYRPLELATFIYPFDA